MRFLFTTFEGGGHVPPAIRVALRLKDAGHAVLFVSDEANRAQVEPAGLPFTPWRTAPNRHALGAPDDPLNEWRFRWPPAVVRAVCRSVISGPAGAYADDTRELVRDFRPHVIVSNELLFGVILAGEREGVPVALLTANVWCFPTREDVPPFGPGFPPATGRFQEGRERTSRGLIRAWYDAGLEDLNAARRRHGLAPVSRLLDQLDAANLILLGTSRAFDYDRADPPAPFVYAGLLAEAPRWVGTDDVDGLVDPARPNVLVSFSTTYQAQDDLAARCIRALSTLPVNGIVTLGPALDRERLPRADNVRVVTSASHDALLPRCALMICHAGHGTAARALTYGVPLVCLPTGRDQPENAARIAWAGAGLRLRPGASDKQIRKAVTTVLSNTAYREAARALGHRMLQNSDGGRGAAEALVSLAQANDLACAPGR